MSESRSNFDCEHVCCKISFGGGWFWMKQWFEQVCCKTVLQDYETMNEQVSLERFFIQANGI